MVRPRRSPVRWRRLAGTLPSMRRSRLASAGCRRCPFTNQIQLCALWRCSARSCTPIDLPLVAPANRPK